MDNAIQIKRRPGYLKRYADHAGIALSSAAEQLKRIGIDYHHEFDFLEADRRREAARHAARTAFAKPIPKDPMSEEEIDPETRKHPTFIESQAEREKFRAKLTELEYQERVGELISAKAVDDEWYRLTRMVRDSMLNIPARIADQLAHETDQRKVQDLLEAEINQALETIATHEEHAT
ncbi:MAG: hypothetical protein JSS38_01510 [Nitrospira sp.]|nr:hypothetical protein [Nitrospira sp.]